MRGGGAASAPPHPGVRQQAAATPSQQVAGSMVNEVRRRMGHSGTPLDSAGLVPRVPAG
jgi:hypothetical protein